MVFLASEIRNLLRAHAVWIALLFSIPIATAHADGIYTDSTVTRVEYQGLVYEVEEGWVYQVIDQSREPLFSYYDPYFVTNNYSTNSGNHFRLVNGYGYVPSRNGYVEDFENINTITDLIGPAPANWTSMTLQSPAAPTVDEYVALRRQILNLQSDFIDNRIDMTSSRVHNGDSAVRFYAVAPSGGLDHTKTSLDNDLVYFEKGDTFRFSSWFYLEQGRPDSIMDLESSYIDEAPGVRIVLDDERRPSVELKFATKPLYKMNPPATAKFPINEWVKIELKLYLSDEDNEGRVELWMNGSKIIDRFGRTMTLFDAVYDSLQVGVTANSSSSATILYADEISVSESP